MSCDFLSGSCMVRKAEPGDVLSPYVKATFHHSNVSITVGNNSTNDGKNNAVIRDFEFGHSDGCQCRITIHDQAGSDFVKFMENLLKETTYASPSGGYTMDVEYGWVKSTCGGSESPNKSPKYYMTCDSISCNFTGGKFIYEIGGADVVDRMFEAKSPEIFGTAEDKWFLTDAIEKLYTESPPSVSSVKFKQMSEDNQPIDLEWKLYDEGDKTKGPKGIWNCNNLDKVNCVKEWCSKFTSKNGKAIRPTYNSLVRGGEVIFWEDYMPGCGETKDYDSNCLGSYVVNGGDDNPVIEFNPKIRWDFFSVGQTSGGTMANDQVMQNTKGGKQQGDKDCPEIKSEAKFGPEMTTAQDSVSEEVGMTPQQAADAQTAQMKTYSLFYQPFEAELVIMGDPALTRPSEAIWTKNVKIVFLNPYHLFESDGQCGDWLQEPACNPWLTNEAWIVKNITHRINDGKYITSLTLFLTSPGTQIGINEPLGGPGSGGPNIAGESSGGGGPVA
jgi:hypothetical protein